MIFKGTAALVLMAVTAAPLAAEGRISTIELELYSHAGAYYSQALTASGKVTVEVVQSEAEVDIAKIRGTATVSPAVFEALRELVSGIEGAAPNAFSRREVDAVVVMRDLNEQVVEEVRLDRVSPTRRRLLLDLFALLHTYASDTEVNFLGAVDWTSRSGGVRDARILLHLYGIEALLVVVLVVLSIGVIRKAK